MSEPNPKNTPIRIELPTPFFVGSVNAYLFLEPEPILVDCGVKSDESWAALNAGLAENGVTISDISRVIITHPHVDHFGLAGRIATEGDVEIWVAELGARWLRETAVMWQERFLFNRNHFMNHCGLSNEMIEQIEAGMTAVSTQSDDIPAHCIKTFKVGDKLQMGGVGWDVLHVPGHSYFQTCFYQLETQQLLSADHLLAIAPVPVIEHSPQNMAQRILGLPQFMESLDKIEALAVEMVYPGHGRPFTHHRRVIQRQRERIEKRKAECLTLIQNGYQTILPLFTKMYPHHVSQFRIDGLWMLVGYLDLLKAANLIKEEMIDGVWHYEQRASLQEASL